MDLPVSLFKEETTDVIRHLPQERVRERFVECRVADTGPADWMGALLLVPAP